MRARVIATMTLRDGFVVKTRAFDEITYIGDPINTVKILNDKGIDELVMLDISRPRSGEPIGVQQLERIATEAFMPVTFGGGLRTSKDARSALAAGVEKVAFNSAILSNPDTVRETAAAYGCQAVVAVMDVDKNHRVIPGGHGRPLMMSPGHWAQRACDLGAGEILVTASSREGSYRGYDLNLVREVSEAVSVPVVANGGAGTMEHFAQAVEAGASAVAAGSMFTFYGPHRAVLITYPTEAELDSWLPAVSFPERTDA